MKMQRQQAKTGYEIPSARYGFTIAEILLVVAIIALIAGASGGIWVGTYNNMLAKKAAKDLLFTAKYAAILAVEQQSQCQIQLDAENNRFWLVISQLNEETDQTEQAIVQNSYSKPVQFGADVKFEHIQIDPTDLQAVSSSDENNTIVFSPNGTAQSAVIQIGNGKNHYTVTICAATGKATLYSGTAENVRIGTIDLDEI